MSGYGQFCPVAKATEVIGGRWTPLVLRELLFGSRRFNDLQRGVPLMSRTLLAHRLRQLADAGIITSIGKDRGLGYEYALTPAGEALRPVIEALSQWGQTYGQARIAPEDYDPALFAWGLRRQIDPARLPEQRFIIRFDFRNVPRRRRAFHTWWLLLDRREIDICAKDPGFQIDAVVSADIGALVRMWLGYARLAAAIRSGAVQIEGSRMACKLVENLFHPRSAASPGPAAGRCSAGNPVKFRNARI
jgi:DNA-binding HxlR family transcriptional regulator